MNQFRGAGCIDTCAELRADAQPAPRLVGFLGEEYLPFHARRVEHIGKRLQVSGELRREQHVKRASDRMSHIGY